MNRYLGGALLLLLLRLVLPLPRPAGQPANQPASHELPIPIGATISLPCRTFCLGLSAAGLAKSFDKFAKTLRV